jgi:hypothetical protein
MRDLLAAATPRPWEPDGSTAVSWERDIVQETSGAAIAQHVATDNAALIVAAVNEYEALLDLVTAATRIQADPHGTISDKNIDLLNAALARLDALRAEREMLS